MNKIEYELLKALSTNTHRYMTSKQLAQLLDVSDKTVQKYIHLLNDELKSVEAVISSTKGLGYLLTVHAKEKFEQWIVQEKQRLQAIDIQHIETPEDRQYFILYQLFFNAKECLTVPYFCDLLYVSKTVITTDLQQIKQALAMWQLRLIKRANEGLCIQGSEKAKRQCMMHVFFNDNTSNVLFEYSQYDALLQDVPLEHLMIIVIEECRRYTLKVSDYVLHNLVLHLALAIKRLQMGKEIEYQVFDGFNPQSASYHVAQCITQRITQELHINFPLEEANYIALHLSVKANAPICHDCKTDDLMEQLRLAIRQFSQSYLSTDELANDRELLNGLHSHFIPLLTRLKQNVPLYNPLLSEMSTMYAVEMDKSQSVFSKMSCLSGYTLSIDEAAYITLHLLAAVERLKNRKKQRILVICASGLGSSQMVRNRLEREFDSYLDIVDVISYHELNTRDLQEIDFIVSTIQVDNLLYPIPVICVSIFLNDNDISRIKEQLAIRILPTVHSNDEAVDRRSILSLFSPQRFLILDDTDKKMVLEKMVGTIPELKMSDLKQQFINRLTLREQYGAVVFNEQVAVPHPSQAMTDKAYCVVAVCPNGIIWDEHYQCVTMVILLSPSIYHNQQIKVLSQILVDVIQDTTTIQKFMKQPTFEQFIDILTRYC